MIEIDHLLKKTHQRGVEQEHGANVTNEDHRPQTTDQERDDGPPTTRKLISKIYPNLKTSFAQKTK